MTAWWLDLLARGWELVVIGFVLIVGAAIWVGPGDDYSCAPSEDEDEDDTAAWDRAHDEFMDREAGIW